MDRVGTGVGGFSLNRVSLGIIRKFSVVLCAQRALGPEPGLCGRDHSLHRLPSLSQVICVGCAVLTACILCNVVSHCSDPYDVGHCLGCGLMTIVRSLNDTGLNSVVRNTETTGCNVCLAQIAVFLTVCDNVIVQRQESLCIGLVAVFFFLGSGACSGCSQRKHGSGNNGSGKCSSKNCFVLFKYHVFFPLSKNLIS